MEGNRLAATLVQIAVYLVGTLIMLQRLAMFAQHFLDPPKRGEDVSQQLCLGRCRAQAGQRLKGVRMGILGAPHAGQRFRLQPFGRCQCFITFIIYELTGQDFRTLGQGKGGRRIGHHHGARRINCFRESMNSFSVLCAHSGRHQNQNQAQDDRNNRQWTCRQTHKHSPNASLWTAMMPDSTSPR